MCGIAGAIHLSGEAPVEQGMLRRMTDAIYHRGPDEDGYFRRPGLGLAMRRLSIVGLADGQQPKANEDGSITVVFNGELFEHRQVRQQLQARGHRLVTGCDTEILPHLWEEHAEGMFERLRGQFAIALWDQTQRRLTLARDRFGICPLFWTRQGDWLLFASEIKALLASGMVEPRADLRGLNHAFTFFALPGPRTCFEGINCLLPGHYLTIQPGEGHDEARIVDRPYWEINFPERGHERRVSNVDTLVDEFEQVMLTAVERRLRADVPVVSYLSGGVDSSLVVAMASKIRGETGNPPIPTFTIQITDPSLDEAREAALVSRHTKSETVVVPCGRREVLETYPELIRAAEGPVTDTSCAALLMLAREVHARGYKVAMTGEGADEWLAGYPWYKVHKLLRRLDSIPGLPLSHLLRRLYVRVTKAPHVSWERARRATDAVGGPCAWLDMYGMIGSARLRLFSQESLRELGDHVAYEDLQLNVEQARRWDPLNRSLMVGARIMLPGLLLASKGDRVAMNSSVETRYPFLDEDVFDFLAQVPPRLKLRGFEEKYLLKKLAERWLPREIAWRRKAMFRAPFDGFHGQEDALPTFADQLLSEESLRKTGYFDPQAVLHWRRAFRDLRPGSGQRTAIEMGLVGVVGTQLWHHTFLDPTLCDLPGYEAAATTHAAEPQEVA